MPSKLTMGHIVRELIFYLQKRQDGGTRTAVALDDDTLLHRFETGQKPSDPALLWYVDVRCKGARLPIEPEKVRQWFLDQGPVIRKALSTLSEKLRAGVDLELWPLQWPVPGSPRGARMSIVCSAIRRMTLLDLARILTELRDEWETIIRNLPVAKPVSSRAG